jgi:hypothetical protein
MGPRSRVVWDGIVPEARSLLQSKSICSKALNIISRMNPIRQAEVARLMVAAACYSTPYARALIGAADLSNLNGVKARAKVPMPAEQGKAINLEITLLAIQLNQLSKLKGLDLITLQISRRYTERLLSNQRIRKYLERKWPAIYTDLADLVYGI